MAANKIVHVGIPQARAIIRNKAGKKCEFVRGAAEALAAANKRVSNILATPPASDAVVKDSLLTEPAEQELAKQLAAMKEQVAPLFANHQYKEALAALAGLRAAVDRFFDEVMVMAEDSKLRANRLALLTGLRELFWEVADISQLAVSQ